MYFRQNLAGLNCELNIKQSSNFWCNRMNKQILILWKSFFKLRTADTGGSEVFGFMSMLLWQSKCFYTCVGMCADTVEKWPLMLKANRAVIYSLGQMEGQTLCHHGYFIKLWMSSLTHTVHVPGLLRYPVNQPPQTNTLPKNKLREKKRRQSDTGDLADKLRVWRCQKNPSCLSRYWKRS